MLQLTSKNTLYAKNIIIVNKDNPINIAIIFTPWYNDDSKTISLSGEWLRFMKRWRPSYGDAANDANDDNDNDEDDKGKQEDRKAGIEGMGFPPLEDIIHALGTVAVSSKNNCSNNLTIVSIFITSFDILFAI